MDQLIERLSSLVRKGNDLFQQERPVQYGVLGGYLVLWLLISGSLTQTLLAGLAMGLAWMVGTRKGDCSVSKASLLIPHPDLHKNYFLV